MNEIQTVSQFKTLMENMKKPFYIYKHSTICPTSARAHHNVETFLLTHVFPIYRVLVVENRPLSQHIAEHFRITHQSPQILLISGLQCIWHASHLAITEIALADNIKKAI